MAGRIDGQVVTPPEQIPNDAPQRDAAIPEPGSANQQVEQTRSETARAFGLGSVVNASV